MFVWKRSAVAALAVALAAIFVFTFGLAGIAAASVPAEAFTVVLDAGHGGIDPGVVGGASKVKESEINLKIVKELETLFADAGFRVVLTRKNDGGLYGLPTNGYKRRDMQKRKEIIEEARPNAVISVHQNNFLSDRSRRGGQVFFKPNVIVECGFLSNAEDEKLLLTEEYRKEVALAVFRGTLAFFA